MVIGGGTGGTLVANRLDKMLGPEGVMITVVDRDDAHLYQPGLLFVPFGGAGVPELTRSRRHQLRPGIDLTLGEVERVDVKSREVHLLPGKDGSELTLPYDVLVVASGAVLALDETEGLTGPGWGDTVHTFYSPAGAQRLARALEGFSRGRLVVNVIDMPIKCPVAPLEFCFLADAYLSRRGCRRDVELSYVTPLDAAFTEPVCAETLGGLLEQKNISLVTEFNTGSVDGEKRRLTAYDGRQVDFDLAVVVPLHSGAGFVAKSPGLGDELGFVEVDPHTLQAKCDERVFAVGDAAAVPTSKAGSVAHFEGEVLVENVARLLAGQPLTASFDGHTNCFVETGFNKALLVDFNYDTEPLPGHFPGRFGLPLLRQSRLNHLAKLAFEPFYWHALLPGHDLPGVGSGMPRRGKELIAIPPATPS